MKSDIAELRGKLYRTIESDGVSSPKVLELSRELDILLLKYYEFCLKFDKAAINKA